MSAGIGKQYRNLVWWTMDVTGISQSITWKVLVAVGIQFGVSVALTLIPLVFSGWLRLWATGALFGLAIVAFVNTLLILREDIIKPMLALQTATQKIESGDLDIDVPATDQRDEIGSLSRSFADMHDHLTVVAAQAEALAEQDFDRPVLDRDIPGRFGLLLSRMTDNLNEYVEQVEEDRDRFQLLNYLVGHDIPNLVNISYVRLDLLRERVDDDESTQHIDIIENQTKEIEFISNTVSELTSEKSVRRVDTKHILAREADRIRESFPEATITLDLPDSAVYLRCNDLLSRVVENLIVNGIEHNDSPEPRVDVELTDAGEYVELVISDNGPGLDIDDPERLFERVNEGTGLNIVHTIVGTFGGKLSLEESSSDGSTFVVRLPRQTPPDETPADWFEKQQEA
ncbi:MAG: ATP-binding protein [Haloarculaceae archaeon]